MKASQKLAVIAGFGLCFVVFFSGFMTTIKKTEYTVEIYDIFEVDHTSNSRGSWTNVYTNGSGQFFFRGDHPICDCKAYSFTFEQNGKRWRDLTLIEYHEIQVLKRGID